MRFTMLAGLVLCLFMAAGCATVDPVKAGLPESYGQPITVRDAAGQILAILWADGKLDVKAASELVIRTLLNDAIQAKQKLVQTEQELQKAKAAAIPKAEN